MGNKSKEMDMMNSLNRSKNRAIFTNVLGTFSIILMILPVFTIFTFIYYGFGFDSSKGNHFIKVAADTLTVTEPNVIVDVDNVRHRIQLLSMDVTFDKYKKVGRDTVFDADETFSIWLNTAEAPDRKRWTKEDVQFIHPSQESPYDYGFDDSPYQVLENLPEGTVSELFVSFDSVYTINEVNEIFEDVELSILWNAVYTGIEDDEYFLINSTPIGYPSQSQSINSSFNANGEKGEQFIHVLENLMAQEEWAEVISKRSNLYISERTDYVKENGVTVYGVVVTGPTKELLALESISEVQNVKLGEVALWNWE